MYLCIYVFWYFCIYVFIHCVCFRFASSTSGRIYLHTDIRVIFAQQPPDLSSRFRVWTVTNGPTDPTYSPRKDGHTCRHTKDASAVDCKLDLRNSSNGCEHTRFIPRTDKHTRTHSKDGSTVDGGIVLPNKTDGCRHELFTPMMGGLGNPKDASRIEYESIRADGQKSKDSPGKGNKYED